MMSIPPLETMQQINVLLQAGDLRTAHDRLQGVIAAHPGYGEALRLLGGVKLTLGDTAGAEQVLRTAAALEPAWPPALTMLGELLLDSGRHAEAEPFLLRAASATQADPRAALVLARRYNDTRRAAQALAIASPFCATGKAAPELVEQHVAALAALGRKHKAVEFYRNLVAQTPDNPATGHALTIALHASGLQGEAAQVTQRVLGAGYRSAALYYTRARGLVAQGEFEAAEVALRDCLEMDPRHVDAHNDLARLVWMRSGNSEQAAAALDDALRKFANHDALWAAKAAVLQGAGDPRAAYACLAPRVERAQAPPALLIRAGLAALEFDPGAALKLASRALRVLPTDTSSRKLMVAAQLGVGDARGALPLCETLLAGEPDDQYLIALQTTAWRMLGDERYAQLCDYRTRVVAYQLETPPAWRSLAGFLADVQQSLTKLHGALRHPLLFQSLRHGTETPEDLTRSTDPVVQELFKVFDAPIRDYIAHIGRGADPLQRRNHGKYRFNGSWSVRLRTSGFHHNHVHPRGWISSACYIDLPDSMAEAQSHEGILTFGEPGILTTPALRAEHEIRPQVGMLALFPSYFWHGTLPFSADRTRLTVAFDAVPAN